MSLSSLHLEDDPELFTSRGYPPALYIYRMSLNYLNLEDVPELIDILFPF
jgi:hypothetical protein